MGSAVADLVQCRQSISGMQLFDVMQAVDSEINNLNTRLQRLEMNAGIPMETLGKPKEKE